MITGRILTVLLVAAVVAGGIGGAALGDDGELTSETLEAVDVRKDDAQPDAELVDDDEDDDPSGDLDNTRGDDGTNQGDNTGDGDATEGDDGTEQGDNTPDGDDSAGNDGTGGGDGTGGDASAGNGGDGTLGGGEATDQGDDVAVAAAPSPAPVPAPAPAPVYDDYSDDGGYAVSGS